MDRIMSTSIILLDQNFNANYVEIMVFEPSFLFPPHQPQFGGGVDDMVPQVVHRIFCVCDEKKKICSGNYSWLSNSQKLFEFCVNDSSPLRVPLVYSMPYSMKALAFCV